MRKVFSLLVAAGLAFAPGQAICAQADQGAQSVPSDPNYRWHNGRWWYWQAAPQRWMIWDDGQWRPHQPQAQRPRTVRRYSYSPEVSSGSIGSPSRSGSNSGRIQRSFGNRPAATKAHGNY